MKTQHPQSKAPWEANRSIPTQFLDFPLSTAKFGGRTKGFTLVVTKAIIRKNSTAHNRRYAQGAKAHIPAFNNS